jgi:peptidyl-prolyl cis-trans isomerase C
VLAVVGSAEIRVPDYRREVERRHAVQLAARDPRVLLEAMVERRLLLEKALRLGLDRDPDIRRSYENLLIGRLRDEKLEARLRNVTVSEAEIRRYYEAQRDEFSRPARIKLAILVRRITKRNREKVRAALEAVRREAAALPVTDGFGALAIRNSEDQVSRYRGGDVGWFVAGRPHPRWPAAVREAGNALAEPGTVSDVIETGGKAYLVRLLARKAASVEPLDAVRGKIRKILKRTKQARIEDDFMRSLRAELGVRIDENALERLAASLRRDTPRKPAGPPPPPSPPGK